MTDIAGDTLARTKRLAAMIHAKRLMEERQLQSDLGEPGRLGGLIHFIRYFWHVLEPTTPLVEGWVLHAICLHLEAVTRGEIRRLLINVPPGFMKSLCTNVFWPLWEWSAAGRPSERFVTFSYGAHLTLRDNAKFRDLAICTDFRELWGAAFDLKKAGEVKPENDHTGWKFASSVGGIGTGERGSRVLCLPGSEKILTDNGWLPIGDIVEGRFLVKIAGFDHETQQIVWQDIEAYERNPGNEIVEVASEEGTIRCTGDHPVFVQGRGYARADSLQSGEQLVWAGCGFDLSSLQRADKAQAQPSPQVLQYPVPSGRGKSVRPKAQQPSMWDMRLPSLQAASSFGSLGSALLQQKVLRPSKNRGQQSCLCWRPRHPQVRGLRDALSGKTKTSNIVQMLLAGMRYNATLGYERLRKKPAAAPAVMQAVQTAIQAVLSRFAVLRENLRGCSPRLSYAGEGQRPVRSWSSVAQVPSWLDPHAQGADSCTGRQPLPEVRTWARPETRTRRASYRLRQSQLGPEQSDHALSVLPRQNARESSLPSEVETRTVRFVKSIGREDVVYNVRVAPCHNYFASGFLVHNCDDLHSVRYAESEAVRSETVRWVREGMSNRLNDMINDVIIGIGQRVHEEDASNAMMDDGDYVHLMVPMEYDPTRHCATPIGWEDPRAEMGELAWPERFPAEVVAKLKRTLGPYAYSAQYQQSPEPRGGGILKRDWWGTHVLPVGGTFKFQFEYIVASLDPAFTAKQENDPSGFTVWGVYYDRGDAKVCLLHAWKKWLELHGQTMERLPTEDNRSYVKRASQSWGLVEWVAHDCARLRVHQLLIEDKASGHSVAQEIQRLYRDREWGVRLVNPGNLDKRARAYAIQHLFADGMIEAPASESGDLLVFREWAQMVIDECAKFRGLPGDEDNLVDSATQAIKFLRDQGLAVRGDERRALETARMTNKRHGPRPHIYPV